MTISKLDAVKRQVETALHLYFLSRDPVSIYTLAHAAYQILVDLNKHRGGRAMLMEDMVTIYARPNHKKEVYAKIHEAENFFKHANRDPEDTIDFSPDASETVLWEACLKYSELSGEQTPIMQAMNGWFQARHPDLFKYDDWRRDHLLRAHQLVKTLSKEQYYQEFMKLKLRD